MLRKFINSVKEFFKPNLHASVTGERKEEQLENYDALVGDVWVKRLDAFKEAFRTDFLRSPKPVFVYTFTSASDEDFTPEIQNQLRVFVHAELTQKDGIAQFKSTFVNTDLRSVIVEAVGYLGDYDLNKFTPDEISDAPTSSRDLDQHEIRVVEFIREKCYQLYRKELASKTLSGIGVIKKDVVRPNVFSTLGIIEPKGSKIDLCPKVFEVRFELNFHSRRLAAIAAGIFANSLRCPKNTVLISYSLESLNESYSIKYYITLCFESTEELIE